jgi:drug/metabolite transporter (DMT)-like permease
MTPLTFSMVLLAALIHAGWNLLAKRAASVGNDFVGAYMLVSAAVYLPVSLWLIANGGLPLSWPVFACLAATCMAQIGYSVALQKGYALADLSVIFPVARGSGTMLASLGALVLLGERPSAFGLAGMAGVVAGIVLIATNGRPHTLFRTEALTSLAWGLGIGLLIASYLLLDGYSVKALKVEPFLLGWFANLFGVLMLTPPMIRKRAATLLRMRGHWLPALIVGLVSPLSYFLMLKAVQLGAPLSLAAPSREMSMMVATLLGALVLRETVGSGRWLGCACVVAGVMLLGKG